MNQQAFLQLVLDNVPTFVFWKDRESNYLGCNKNFALSAGFSSPEELIGKNDYDMPWSNEESDYYRKIDNEVMTSGESKINFEEPQTINDGETGWVRTSKVPLKDDSGKVIGILGTYEDITERKRNELKLKKQSEKLFSLNKELKKSHLQLEQTNIDLEQFAYATSHDLQEPLNNIKMFTDLILKDCNSEIDEEGKKRMGFVKDGVRRMSDLVRGVLNYSKIKDVRGFDLVNLDYLVKDGVSNIAKRLSEANVELVFDLPTEDLKCQPVRMVMLFNNLITNAIKFNRSAQPKIHISHEASENHWLFKVKDNGIGIEDEFRTHVFKPFKRLNNRQKFAGSGLGLSICKRITNVHGGKIWCESNEWNGTTFCFTISKNPTNITEIEVSEEWKENLNYVSE